MDTSKIKQGDFTNDQILKLIKIEAEEKNRAGFILLLDMEKLSTTQKLEILLEYKEYEIDKLVEKIKWDSMIEEFFSFIKQHGMFSTTVFDAVIKVLNTDERITMIEIIKQGPNNFLRCRELTRNCKFDFKKINHEQMMRLYNVFADRGSGYGDEFILLIMKHGKLSKEQLIKIVKYYPLLTVEVIKAQKFSPLEMLKIIDIYVGTYPSSMHNVNEVVDAAIKKVKVNKKKKTVNCTCGRDSCINCTSLA